MTASTHRDCTQGGIATSTLLSSQLKGRLKSREGRGYSRPLLLLLITLELWALKKKNRLSKGIEWNAGRVTNTFMLYLFGLTFSTIEWRELPTWVTNELSHSKTTTLQCFKRDRSLLFGTFQAACVGLYQAGYVGVKVPNESHGSLKHQRVF